jgi:hypothetical protein
MGTLKKPFSACIGTLMSTQRIPLDTLQKIRQYLKTVLVLPESENRPLTAALKPDLSSLPEPDSLAGLGDFFRGGEGMNENVPMPNNCGQWYVSVMDPGVAFMKLPGLQLRSGYRLATYLYRQGEEGVGKTWAIQEAMSTTANLEKALVDAGNEQEPPEPLGCLKDINLAIEGDGSASSYVYASLLRREVSEFGYLGKRSGWAKHQLINAVPQQLQWQWRTEGVKDLSPKVRIMPEGRVVVEFFTCRVTPSIAIFQHLDQYNAGCYLPKTIDRPIAIGERKRQTQAV